MKVQCQTCLEESFADPDSEELPFRSLRCENCGTVGDMFCQHVACHGGACDDCGMEFTDDVYPDDKYEKIH